MASDDQRIQCIVIVGGGTAGWMAAASFSKFLDLNRVKVTLIESDEIGTIGVGEATIPPIITFNGVLGIDEDEFLRETQGTIKLGIEFVDWGGLGQRYFHPFGTHGHEIRGVNFHQLYLRERQRQPMPDIAEYSICAVAAAQGRFARPPKQATGPIASLGYAYQFDATLYARYLRGYAERSGVQRVEGKVVKVDRGAEDGFVEFVTLSDGRTVAGELFVDCSGFRGLLIEEALGTGYEDWSHWLPCDRAIAVPTANVGDPEPFTRSTARSAGWQWRIPLQHRTGNGLVYSSKHLGDDEAERLLLGNLDGETLAEPRHLRFTTGMRWEAWNRNVVSLGLASGFVEPLESTSIHLIQTGIARFLNLFPDRRFNPAERAEYNQVMRAQFEDIRDFIILHYKATQRDDSEFWNACRTMDVPDSLAHKIELFRDKGRCFRAGYDLFHVASWVAVMLGQNVWPEGYDPLAETIDMDDAAGAMERLRLRLTDVVSGMPTHAEFLAKSGAGVAA